MTFVSGGFNESTKHRSDDLAFRQAKHQFKDSATQ